MHKNRKQYLVLILIFFKTCSLSAAWEKQCKNFDYQIGFGQNLNSYQWLSGIKYYKTFYGKGLLEIAEHFNSSLITLSREDSKWKDDQKLNLQLSWLFSPTWGVNFTSAASKFSDRLSGLTSDINMNWTTVGVHYYPTPRIKLVSAAGFKHDNRMDRTDQGLTYNLDLKTTDYVPIKGYLNHFSVLARGDQYAIRKNSDFALTYRVKKYFHQDTFDSLSVYWTKKRRDNYDRISVSEVNIESLEEENRGFHHFLAYGSRDALYFKFRTRVNSRRTRVGRFQQETLVDERSKKEFHSENEVEVSLTRPRFELNAALSYVVENQKNDVPGSQQSPFSKFYYYISPDYNSTRLTLSTRGQYHFSKSDTLQLKGAISIFRYDTPENNMDDRDELRMNLHLLEVHHFSRKLKLVFSSNVNLYHLVYIFSERSANNNWMRIFRLSPRVIYKPNDRVTISQRVEVLANYVDYDYETGTSTADIRSYVFRRFALTHQVTAQITRRSGISLNYKYEIEENGKLNWDKWTEILLTDRENHWLRVNLNYKLNRGIIISPGLIFFKRDERKQNYLSFLSGGSGRSGDMLSYGPTLRLNYQPHEKMNLTFDGIRRAIERPSEDRRFINYFNLRLTWCR